MPAELLVVGLSHRTAPLDVRERLGFSDDELAGALKAINELPYVGEALLVSTCNRVEIYAATRADVSRAAVPASAGELRRFFAQARSMEDEALGRHLYERAGVDAIRHIFRVASSLDSLVIGETQILGQVKSAYGAATQGGFVGPILGRCMERAFSVAKRVRTETAVSRGGASISSVAVDLARRIFGELEGKRVLVVGAGKMSGLAARKLRSAGCASITVTNRSMERAEELARDVDGAARSMEDLEILLATTDIVITSTGSKEPVLTRSLMKGVMKVRRYEPLFLIDIAVPRDVEAKVGKLDGVYLFDVDDLEKVVAENIKERQREAERAEKIVEEEAAQFLSWLRAQGVVPTIKELRQRFIEVAQTEVERTAQRLRRQAGVDEAVLRALAESIVNKLLHSPLMALKHGDEEQLDALVTATRRLFALPGEGGDAPGTASSPSGATPAGDEPAARKVKP